MKRLLTFLYLLLGLVLLNTQKVRAQTVFMNAPDTTCAGSFATVNGMIWDQNAVTVDNMVWTVTPADPTATIKLLSGKLGAAMLPVYSGVTAVTVRLDSVGKYTFKVTIFGTDNNTHKKSSWTKSVVIYAADCSIQKCEGNTQNVGSNFLEDFGTFNVGDPRRSSPYVPGYIFNGNPASALADNEYCVYYTTLHDVKDDWVDARDKSQTGTGGMLVANSSVDKKTVYKRQVDNLCPGSVYNFSAWFLNINSDKTINSICARSTETPPGYKYAGVTFIVRDLSGVELKRFKTYNVSMNLTAYQWQQYGGSFKTKPGVTSVTVEIQNDNPGGCGNDIAIDNIEFKYCDPNIYAFIDGQVDTHVIEDKICAGSPINMTSIYTPSDYFTKATFQWQRSDDNVTWTDLSNGPALAGATDSILQVKNGYLVGDPLAPKLIWFRVKITENGNGASCANPSYPTKLTILPKPQVTVSSGRICKGSGVDLTANGGYSVYEWRVIPVVTGPTLHVVPDTTTTYRAIGIADYGNNRICKDSGEAKVIVDTVPKIKIVGGPAEICLNAGVTLQINPIGAYNGVTWQNNTTVIPGLPANTLKITDVPVDTGTKVYNVIVQNVTCFAYDTMRIRVRSMPVADADTVIKQCNNKNFTILRKALPADMQGQWTFIGADQGAIITSPNSATTTVTGVPAGKTVTLLWTITNIYKPDCIATCKATLTNTPPLTASIAGPDIVQCGLTNNTFQLAGSQPGIGETGKWTVNPPTNPATVSFNSDVAYNAVATFISPTLPTNVVLTWTISNGGVCADNTSKINLSLKAAPDVKATAPNVCNTSGTFVVKYSNATGTINQYAINVDPAAVATRKMPSFTAITNGVWPGGAAGNISVTLPAGTPVGNYDFIFTVQEGTLLGCAKSVPFTLSVEAPSTTPTSVTASVSSICKTGSATLKVIGGVLGTDPNGTTNASWKWYTGGCPGTPGSVAVSPVLVQPDGSIVTFNNITTTTTYYVRAESAGACSNSNCASATVTVFAQPNVANAGSNQSECNRLTDFQLNGNATGVPGLSGTWTTTNALATIHNPTLPNATVTVPVGQTATLVWTISNGPCLTTSASIIITNYAIPANADAGVNITNCNNTSFIMNAKAPTEFGAAGKWTYPAIPGMTVSSDTDPKATISIPVGNSVVFTWTVSNGTCPATSATVTLSNYAVPANADAGKDQVNCNNTNFTMTAKAPAELGASGKWTYPVIAGMTVSSDTDPKATISIPVGTSVTFTWTVSNGTCPATAATVTLSNFAVPANADAGKNQANCNNTSFTMTAKAPTELGASGKWTYPATPGMTVSSDTDPKATISIPVGTSVTFTWTVSNGKCAATAATVTLSNYAVPANADAGKDQVNCNNTSFTMTAKAPTELGASGKWTYPAIVGMTVSSDTDPKATIFIPVGTSVTFTWTVSNGKCAATAATVTLSNYAVPANADAGKDQANCNNTSFTMTAKAPTELGASGKWTYPATPGMTVSSDTDPKATISIPVGTSVTFTWTVSNGKCAATSATVTLSNYAVPAIADAGKDQVNCNNTNFTMTAKAPTELGASGKWTYPVIVGMTVSSDTDPKATISIPVGNSVTFTWTVSNGKCAATSATVTLSNFAVPANADAGKDQANCNNTSFTMTAKAPTELGASGKWTYPATPGMTVSSDTDPKATISIPVGTSVTFTWTVSNGTCAATSDKVILSNYAVPAIADAGKDQVNCNNTNFTMTAKAPTELGASGKWTYPATPGMTVSSDTDPKATISIPVGTSVTFTWTVSNGKCAATAATVTLSNYAVPAIADAGKDQVNCNNTSFTMTAKAPTELGASGKWTYPATPGMTVSSDTDPKATISIPVGTSVTFTWTVSNGKCAATAATVTLSNYAVPANADAGKDQANCNNTSFTMTAKAPTELGASGKWTYPATPGMTVSSDTDPKATISIPVGTSVTFTWTVSNGKCAATAATVTLSNYAVPAIADAGKDQVNCNNTSFTMTAKAPTELGASGKWTYPVIVGMTVSSDTDPKATISIPVGNSVTFTWTVSNGKCAATSATVTLSNFAVPANADAGKDQANCNNTSFTMTAKAPTELGASGKWTYPATPGMTVSSDTDPKATISIPVGTSVTFTWTVSNGKCAATAATVTLSNYAVPASADAGKDQVNCNNTSFTMTAKAPTELGASGKWTYPATPGMTVSSDTDPKATISIPVGTSVTFTWTVSNGKCAATAATVTLSNYAVPAIADAGKNQVNCNNTSFTMTAKAPTELGASGKWTYPATPGMTVSSDTDPKATISIPVGTSVTFTWTVSNGKCAATAATVTLSNYAVPAIADAGKDQVNCNNTSFTMTAKAPTELGASGKWTYPVIVGMTVSSDTDPKATISIPVGTSVTFTWTVSNGTCAATSATVTLSNYAVPAIADAGKNQVNCNNTNFTMTAKAPTELGASGKWTYPVIVGMTVSSDTDPKATISIPVGTSVTFTWTVSNGKCAATSATVTLSNYAVPANADAGKNQVNCNNTSFTMTAKAPTELGASGKWTYPVVTGMTVSSDTDPKATISIPVGTSVTFTWTVSNGKCAATAATVTLSNYAVPAIADAGKDQVNCNNTSFTMTAKAPTELGASGKWTYPVIVGMTVSSDTDPKATISIPVGTSVTFTWTVSNGKCAATAATVTLSNYAVPAIADAGKDQINCNNTSFTMTAKAPTELGASGKWTYPATPGMTVSSDTDPKATISIPVGTSVTFTWTVSNGKCAATAATVTLSNYAVPASADAGKDQVNCNNTSFTMTAKAPTELGASGKWTYPAIVGMTVSSDTDPKATISIPVGTSVTFTWTVSNGTCAATSDKVTLSNYAVPAIADAGKDQVNCNNTNFTMTAKAPTELGASGKWTYPVIVGMTVSSDTDPKATISIPVGTSVTFTWTVSNGKCAATAATVTLSNYAVPAIADAGKDQANCNNTSFTMTAKAPTELGASGKWTYPATPGMTVSSDTDPKATISIPVGTSVTFTWTVSNGKCAATAATVTLSNYAVPAIADAGKDQANCNNTSFTMTAKAPTELGAAGKWTYPAIPGMTVSSDTDPKATISIPVGTSVTFTWTVSNGKCAATTATVTLSNFAVPAIADAGKNQVNCNNTSFTMTAKAPTELGASGKWTYPVIVGMTVSSDTDPKATISIPVGTSVTFTWTVSNGKCAATAATVTLSNYAVPAIADAGKDQVNCNSTGFTMTAKAPTELGASGKWTYPATPGMTVSSDTDPKATISIPVGTSVTFTWTVSNGICAATSDKVTLSNYAVPASADAGKDQVNCNNTSFTMTAKAPTELGASGKWTYPVIVGMTVSSDTDPKATISIPVGTSVKFTWTVSNGICAATSATVTLSNYAVPAIADAGKDQVNCNSTNFTMTAKAPTELGASGKWTYPVIVGMTVSSDTDPKATISIPMGNSVKFTWTVSNGTCAATSATVTLSNYAVPAIADAGKNQVNCNNTNFTMTAKAPTELGASGKWTYPVIVGMTVSSDTDPKATISIPVGTSVTFTWTVSNGKCAATAATVTLSNYAVPANADAGKDQVNCNNTNFTMTAKAPTELGASGKWTYPVIVGMTVSSDTDPKATISIPVGTSVTFTWTVSNGKCAATSATVTLSNYAVPAIADAGKDQVNCNNTSFTMTAKAPTELGASGKWTYPVIVGMTVSSDTDPKATISIPVGNSVKFTWTVSNGTCAATAATVTLSNYAIPAIADAGKDQVNCNSTSFTMNAKAPTELGASGKWTYPVIAGMTVSSDTDPKATISIPVGNSVKFTWTVSNGKCAATTATVTLSNYAVPAIADAGKNQVNCNSTGFIMNAKAPTELGAAGKWTYPVVTGMTVSSDTDPKATISIPVGNSVKFTWTVSNGTCAATSATITLSNYAVPAIADAGKDQVNCNSTSFTMTAKAPTELGASGKWTYPVIAGMTVSSDTDPKATISIPVGNSVKFTWTVSNGICAATAATVTLSNYAVPAIADAGKDQVNCNSTSFTMNAKAPTELGAAGKWTYPVIAGMTVSSDTDPKATISIPVGNSVKFTWTVSNGKCAATSATITLSNYAVPAKADAGLDQKNCNNTSFTMNAKAPTELGAAGKWTYPATPGMTVSSNTDPKATISIPVGTSITFTWTVSNGTCAATSDQVILTNYAIPAVAKAGKDQENCNNPSFTLNGNAPTEYGAVGTWTVPAGTTGVTITNPNQANTTVTVTAGQSVTFTWTITNGTCAATADKVVITNYATANKANAGPDQKICGKTDDFKMAANTPSVATAKGIWTDISRIPGKATIKSPNDPFTNVTVPIGDTVVLQWAIGNGVCDSTFSRVTIINYKTATTANAGPDQEKCNTTADFKMSASAPGATSATGVWTDVSRIPSLASIKEPNNPLTAVTVPLGDTVILKWTVTNGACASSSSTVTLINYAKAADANAGPDQEMCNATGDFTMAADALSVPSAKGFWSIVKGSAVIKSINNPASGVNVNVGDTVTLRWTVTNGVCSATWDDVTLINYRSPVKANAGANSEHCNVDTFHMHASDPGVAGAIGTWVVTSSNASLINIAGINKKDAIVTVPAGETAQLTWVVSNGVCDATSSSVTLINRKPILGNTITADQTVCATETPMAISSNVLTGGNGIYTYQWQKSTTSATGPFTNITGATGDTYQPPVLTANTWYRRVVASGACIDNTSNAVKITVVTLSPIVTSVPPAITTECIQGKDYTTLFSTPVFSHAPYNNENLTITYNDATVVSSACLSTITRTWTAKDRCGLMVTASQTITIRDTKAPVFTTSAPADITVDCDKVPAKVDLTAKDDCAGDIIVPVVEVRQDMPGSCSNNYQLIRTWTAKDACNTGVTLRQVITVKDMTAPVFDMPAPADTTVDCDKIPTGINLTAKDNCTPGVITVVPKDSIVRNTSNCASNYLIYRKWTAFDECGNARAVQQIISVQDTTKPVFNMPTPKDTVVDCDKVPAWTTITATDNCTSNIQVFTSSKTVKLPGSCAGNYQEIRTWTATDDCGNNTSIQQIITVQDTTKPVFTVKPPADTTVSCDNIPAPATDVKVSDNCSTIGNGLTLSRKIYTESIPGACASNYRIIRLWTAKDACGNTSTVTQVVTVKDTTRPVIMPAPADVVIFCQDKIPTPPVLTATDNCDAAFPKRAIYTEDPFVKDICNGYTIVRRWSIMDACGNRADDVTQRVIVKPCAKPQLEANLPANCSDMPNIALHAVGNVSIPTYTLVSVTPANAVTGLPMTQNNNVFNLNGATSASFIITDGVTGCSSDTMTYNLTYIQKPVVNLGNDTTICGGNSLVLDAGAANFAYSIKWSTGATTQRINITAAGTYWVNVSNGQCSTTDTIHVGLVPTPLVTIPDTTICRGQSVKLDAYVDGAQYLWSNGSTASSILVSTQEQFWVKVMKTGCITIDTIKVSVNPPPDISLSRDTAICPDQSIMLTVNSNGGRIQWQTGETSNSIVVNKPGGYWVAVSRDNCVVRDTVNVRMKPTIKLDLGPDKNICPGATVTLDGTNPDAISYLWNDGDPNPVKQVTQAGKYKLAVMDRFCQQVFMDSVKVNITGLPKIDLGRDTTLCKGETLILRAEGGGITGARWDNGTSGPTLTVTNGGTYTVTVFNDCGTATDNITVDFIQCEPKPTVPNAFSPNGDGRNDVFRPIVRGQMFEYELRIFNRWGELIFITSDDHRGWDGKYKGTPVDVGTYVWWLSYKKVAGGKSNVLKGEVTVVR